jgi:hypothetical protein
MRDCNVQGAGVPDGAIYKEVVVIGTFLFLKNVDFTREITSNLISVWVVYSGEVSSFFARSEGLGNIVPLIFNFGSRLM